MRSDADLVRAAIEHVGALEIEDALGLVTDDFVLELPFRADGGPTSMPRDDAARFMRSLPRLFARMEFHDVVVHSTTTPGVLVAEYTSNGLTRAGRPYPNSYVAVFEVREHAIARWREYFDPRVVAAAFPG